MKQVLEFIRQQELIKEGDHVVAGVSGGADSVYLLFALLAYQEEQKFKISVIHVHHNLRGAEADRDAQYVRELCLERSLPFTLISVDVKERAAREKISTEEAGRLARYEAFERFCEEQGGTKIALAHHQNDLAETMIYHLARGTGMKGLTGILPKRGKIIRPLLCMKRQEIEHYLNENHIKYVTDSTNAQDEYTRNRIRHHVVEYLEEKVNTRTVEHMAKTAAEIGQVQDYLEKQANQLYLRLVNGNGQEQLLSMELFEPDVPAFLQNQVIRRCILELTGSLKDITRVHLNQVRELSGKPVGKTVDLPDGLTARKQYAGIGLFCQEKRTVRESAVKTENIWVEPEIPGVCSVDGMQIFCSLEKNNRKIIPEKSYTKWLNYDKIKGTIVLRTRRPGDYLVINQNGGRKKLKDYLIDQKIPREERDHVLLLCVGSEVLWVCGYRISEAYKVYEDTEMILKIQIQGGNVHE